MAQQREVVAVRTSKSAMDGAGVQLNRVFGHPEVPDFDPFLLLDDFGSENPDDYLAGFPWHPHRGIETVTYMLTGEVEHGDSLGNQGVIRSGDVQWMTAGSGIIHQEMPRRVQGRMRGFQLWVNLPAASKMMEPRYRDVPADTIPEANPGSGIQVKVIAGEIDGVRGPVQDVVADPTYLDFTVAPGIEFEHPTPESHTVFAYVVDGAGNFGTDKAQQVVRGQVALTGDGTSLRISSGDSPLRFLLVSGRPLGEPVAWNGPIVMNTGEELAAAFREYRDGTFTARKE
jgi:redox-sensitive bicupin YhaK (pirin superfamily)